MQEINNNLSISPSCSNSHLTAVIPRLLPGELLARHVATLKAEDALTCGWCGEPFLEGQEWMIDVYQQDGESDTTIKALGKPQVFKKTAVLMVHASDCLLQSCTKAVSDCTERVCFSQRKALVMSEDDMRSVVWKQFRWAVRWISWHHQYLIHDPIDMVLGSRRPLLTEGVCPSFVLEMTKSHKYGETVHRVKAPMQLISREFIEALHTRVFEYEMIYKGKYQPILQLKSVFEKSAFNTKLNDANVAAYAHNVVQGSYSSRHADEQHLKLIVKVRPSALHLARLMAIYGAMCEEVTWVMLHEHAQATRPDKPTARGGDSDAEDDEDADDGSDELLMALLFEMQQSFILSESEVNRALTSAGMQVNKNGKHRAFTAVSSIALAQNNGHRTSIACPGDANNLVIHCGGLLHPKLDSNAKRLADAVLQRAKDVDVRCPKGATLMMICAEDCFLYGESLFVVLNGLHQTHDCDWNVQDKLGNTPMHEIVDSGDADCLFRLLELQLPGVDCHVRNNKNETFMALASSTMFRARLSNEASLRDFELVNSLCVDWSRHWHSAIRSAVQPHLPVESNSSLVLVDLVVQYIDGSGPDFVDADKQAAIDAELEEMMQAPALMPPDFSATD